MLQRDYLASVVVATVFYTAIERSLRPLRKVTDLGRDTGMKVAGYESASGTKVPNQTWRNRQAGIVRLRALVPPGLQKSRGTKVPK